MITRRIENKKYDLKRARVGFHLNNIEFLTHLVFVYL